MGLCYIDSRSWKGGGYRHVLDRTNAINDS